jgi:lipoate---protein ligase
VQKLEADGVVLARRRSGGGCVYQDLGNSVFSFINPIKDFAQQDFKTMNNEVLIQSLESFGIKGEASGRNDLVVGDRKVSGSAYKLKLGMKDGSGRRSLHHGTMLLDLELGALGKYLNPNKKKLESKGVDSVVSRVLNLKEVAPKITHDSFC